MGPFLFLFSQLSPDFSRKDDVKIIRLILLSLLLFLVSCSSHVLDSRIPNQSANGCHELVSGILNGSDSDIVDRFFLKNPVSIGNVDYQINFDRVEKWVKEFPFQHRNQVQVSKLGRYDGEDVMRMDIPGWGGGDKKKLIITAGVHGNESAGVGTLINVVERFLYNPNIRTQYDITIIPYLNPGGLKNNMRRLNNGVDFNRTLPGGKSTEQKITRFLKTALAVEKFDFGMDLHEAPFRDRFFVIKMFEDDDNLTRSVLDGIPQKYLTTSENGEYPGFMYRAHVPGTEPYPRTSEYVSYELHAPGEVSSFNKGTVKSFFYHQLGAEHSYTFESPGQMDLEEKIKIYTEIVERYLKNYLNLP